MRKQVMAALLAALAAAAGAAHAETREGWYGGIRIGNGKQKVSIDDAFAQQGLTTTTEAAATATSYGIVAGNRLNEFFGVEFGYVNLGRFKYTSTVTSPTPDTITGSYSVRGLDFTPIVYFPFRRKWAGYIKFGIGLLEAKREASSDTGAVPTAGAHQRNISPLGGGGIAYDITRNLTVRGEFLRYIKIGDVGTGKGDVDQYTLGFTYHF